MSREFDEIDSNGNIIRMRFKPTPGYIVPPTHSLVPHTMPLHIAKVLRKEYIETERNKHCYRNVSAIGYVWQADKRSQELITSAIQFATLGISPTPITWRTLDNQDINVSLEDLKIIATAMMAQTQEAYAISWERKLSIDNAASIQEVEEIVWQ